MHTEGVEAFKTILSDPRYYLNCCRLKPAHKVMLWLYFNKNSTIKHFEVPSFFANFTPLSIEPGLSSKSSLVEAKVSARANSSSCSMLVKPGRGFLLSWWESNWAWKRRIQSTLKHELRNATPNIRIIYHLHSMVFFPEIIDGEDVKPFSSSKETSQIASN